MRRWIDRASERGVYLLYIHYIYIYICFATLHLPPSLSEHHHPFSSSPSPFGVLTPFFFFLPPL